VLARFAVQALLLAPLVLATGRIWRMRGRMLHLVILRTALHIAGITLMFSALKYLPLADAIVIFEADFDRPEVKRFLKEQVGKTGIPAWVIYGPDFDEPRTVDSFTPSQLQRLLDEAGGESPPDNPVAAR